MFIFTIISSLISLAFTLLFLPLKLIRIPFAMGAGSLGIVFHLITRHLFLVILLFFSFFIYLQFRDTKPSLPQLVPAPPANPAPQTGQGIPIVQPVRKRENGDSNFATDLYATMTDPERASYSQQFYTAMNNTADGTVYSWANYNIAGAIRPLDTVTNNEGVRCRHFTETLKVHTVQQNISGAACDEGTGAWCKLKPNATLGCGLGGKGPGIFNNLSIGSIKNLF